MGQLLFADAIHITEQAKIDAARITQKSGNERRGAETALQQFSASLANSRALEAAGEQANDIAGNVARMNAAATRGTMQARIAMAEELGAAAAMAGAAGIGGSSVETYNTTVRLQAAIKEQQMNSALTAQGWSAGQQRGNTVKAAIASLDNNVYRANLDYTKYLDHKKPSGFEQMVGLGLTAAATVFGGPQAGAAVAGLFEARQAGRNGDMAGASNAIMGSIQNGMGAARTMHLTSGGSPKAGAVTTQAPPSGPGMDQITNPFLIKRPEWGSIIIK